LQALALAHEVRNPIAYVEMSLELALEEESDSKRRESLHHMLEQCEHVKAMTTKFLQDAVRGSLPQPPATRSHRPCRRRFSKIRR